MNSRRAINFVSSINSGTVKVITGEISKNNPDNLEVNVTTGTIGARGTEFVVVAESNDENKIIKSGMVQKMEVNK